MPKRAATLPGGFHPRVSRPQFVVAVVALTFVMAGTAAWAFLAPRSTMAVWTLMAFQGAMGLNAIVPHIVMWLRLRRYNPGLVTAVFLVLPFSVWFFREAMAEGIVGFRGLLELATLAPGIMVGMTLGSLLLGVTAPRRPCHREKRTDRR